MRRKSVLLAIAIVLFLAGSAGGILYFLVRHEPDFYVRCKVPPGEQRKDLSAAFISECANLFNDWYKNKPWEGRFKEDEINSYFAEDLVSKHSVESPFPEGVSEPRVCLEQGRIRLGFRYGKGWKSTVVSIDMRVWLIAKESNVVALEFEKIRAGLMPISAQSLLDRAADYAHQRDIEAMWYRHNGRPVLVLRFEADKNNPLFQIRELDPRPGLLRIAGRSSDGAAQVTGPGLPNG
ncbi:MAG TPA: hypothetical protein VGY58_08310 [Gemmataceae bacterium]|nr:hypothetical protein [Gemmataceae bacterium]